MLIFQSMSDLLLARMKKKMETMCVYDTHFSDNNLLNTDLCGIMCFLTKKNVLKMQDIYRSANFPLQMHLFSLSVRSAGGKKKRVQNQCQR